MEKTKMEKTKNNWARQAALVSIALCLALVSGCVGSIDEEFPYVHFSSRAAYRKDLLKEDGPALLKEERDASIERMREIAKAIGVNIEGNQSEVALKSEILQRLLDGRVPLPKCEFSKTDIDLIEGELISKKAEVKAACEFIMKLKGKKVLVFDEVEN